MSSESVQHIDWNIQLNETFRLQLASKNKFE